MDLEKEVEKQICQKRQKSIKIKEMAKQPKIDLKEPLGRIQNAKAERAWACEVYTEKASLKTCVQGQDRGDPGGLTREMALDVEDLITLGNDGG